MNHWRPLRTALLASTALVPLAIAAAFANPLGPTVVNGTATVTGTGTANVTVNQTTQNAIINWQTFNLNATDRTTFVQPNATAMTLNRVTGQMGPSTIYGSITANGRVFIVNPEGILIGRGATINTAGFLATTHDISNADFMANRLNFTIPGRPDASVINEGIITASNAGFAALVAPGVRNSGTITATFGRIGLAAANGFTLDLYGDQLITLGVNDTIASQVRDISTGQTLKSLVQNDGVLKANGGQVQLTAAAARTVVDSVINTSGVIEARTIGHRNGKIVLGAATAATKPAGAPQQTVKVSGKLTVASKKSKAGTIQITGENIELTRATLDATGRLGGGTVLIGGDIGGGVINPLVAAIPQATLQAGPVPTASTVTVDGATVINASATHIGDAGKVVVWSDGSTTFNGAILARGGDLGGRGGFVEVSGQQVNLGGHVDLRAPMGPAGTFFIDPIDAFIDPTVDPPVRPAGSTVFTNDYVQDQLALGNFVVTTSYAGHDAGNITVAAPVTWNSTYTLTLHADNNIAINAAITAPVGGLTLEAANTITATAAVNVGTFTLASGAWVQVSASLPEFQATDFRLTGGSFLRALAGTGSVENPYQIADVYGLQGIGSSPTLLSSNYVLANDIDATVTATWNNGNGFVPIGNATTQFIGALNGDHHVIDGLTIVSAADGIGLFGYNSGTLSNIGVTNATITALVPQQSLNQYAGVLAGVNNGPITDAFVTGTVTNGLDVVIPVIYGAFGGLVGQNLNGSITRTYAAVAVHATGPGSGYIDVGGLVGQNHGPISLSYATGDVTATYSSPNTTYLGGLVGWQIAGAIDRSYALGSVTGTGDYGYAGALIGVISGGTVNQTYATGAVSLTGASSFVGGLTAVNNGIVTQSYWDIGTTGQAFGVALGSGTGITGLTTAQARMQTSYLGWDFLHDWVMMDGQTRPFLRSEFSTTIRNTHQFQLMYLDGTANYTLANNIDFAADLANPASMWTPAGLVQFPGPYAGTFDGQNFTVSNLTVNGPSMLAVNNGTIQNIGFENFSVAATADAQAVGLVGINNGTISNVVVSGSVTGGSFNGLSLGGLVGVNNGTIVNAGADVAVTAGGSQISIGGLVGINGPAGVITDSFAIGDVTATADLPVIPVNCSVNCQFVFAGGLVGANWGAISSTLAPTELDPFGTGVTFAIGNVQVGARGIAGGLVGYNDGTLDNVFATSRVTGTAGPGAVGDLDDRGMTVLGGLVGRNTGTLTLGFAFGDVGSLNVAHLRVGGAVGDNAGTVTGVLALGNVMAGNYSVAGGVVASNEPALVPPECGLCLTGIGHNNAATISDGIAIGSVTIGSFGIAGGFAGLNGGTLINANAGGNVLGADNTFLGGLVGVAMLPDTTPVTAPNANALVPNAVVVSPTAVIQDSTAIGSVTSTGANSVVGGLVGLNAMSIIYSLASGPVSGTASSYVGGFAGVNLGLISDSATISLFNPFVSTASVSGANNVVGGFVGANFGAIANSTSATNVTGGPNNLLGAFAGVNTTLQNVAPDLIPNSTFPVGTIVNSTATGTVNGTVGPQIASTNPATLPAYPSIIDGCTNALCQALRGATLPETTPDNTVPASDVVTAAQVLSILNNPQSAPPQNPLPVLIALTQNAPPAGPGPGPGARPAIGQPFAPPQVIRNIVAFDGTRTSGIPPLNETRFIQNEVVLQLPADLSPEEVARIAQQLGLTVISSNDLPSLGRRAIRFRITGGRSVRDIIRQADRNPNVIATPNYQFALAQAPASLPPTPDDNRGDPAQYTLEKWHVHDVHRLALGSNITIAVVDSEVDKTHTELSGAIAKQFDAVGAQDKPHSHGTAMVGAMVARDRLLGIAPRARILAVRSFSESQTTAEGTTINILRGIEWAVSQGARVINMSFAGPYDPALEKALKIAYDKGIVLVAAAGNAGPKSPPLFPGADVHVIGVTATDENNQLFKGANRGPYVSVAAPGVDILAAAPQEAYQMSTGTSIATAHVSAVVALMLERDPTLKPDEVRKILQETATDLGPKGKDTQFGWGLVNPQKALAAVEAHKKRPTATTRP